MLPDRYNRLGVARPLRFVSYIESTGTQYIDTGVLPDYENGDSTSISFYQANYTGASPCVFGSRESGVRNGVYLLGSGLTVADADGYSTVSLTSTTGDHVLTVSDTAVIYDGASKTMPRHVTVGLPMYLFALNNYGSGTFGIYNGMKLYDWRFYRSGTLAQHLVPALLQGVPGMWDMVSRTFYGNAGTGTFNYA